MRRRRLICIRLYGLKIRTENRFNKVHKFSVVQQFYWETSKFVYIAEKILFTELMLERSVMRK